MEGTETIFSTSTSGSSQSFDGGITWNPIDNETFLGVEFLNSTTGWAGSFNGDLAGGIWKWSDFSLSQDEMSNESNFKIYPNPVDDVLNIKSTNDINSTIYDITGKKVLESNSKNINLEKLTKGIYIIKIKDLVYNITESIKIVKK